MSYWPSLLHGQFTNVSDGTNWTGGTGTLSSIITLDRGAAAAGPVPTDTGNGTFSIDLSSYSGFWIVVQVFSTIPMIGPWNYAEGMAIVQVDKPQDLADGRDGRIDTRTGFWVPKHRLAHFRGAPYWDSGVPDAINIPVPDPPGVLKVSETS